MLEVVPAESVAMDALANKSDGIRSIVSELQRRFGQRAFAILDYWPDNPEVIGIARSGKEDPGVCIFTAGKEEGRYDVEHGGTVYRDCVLQGVCWAVRQALKQGRGESRLLD